VLDPIIIRQWWTKWPDAMIGCPMGAESKIFIVDIDRKGGDPDEVLEQLRRDYDIPQTLLARTAGGGYHVYFEYAPGIQRSIRALHPAVDTLGAGGYAILPPSRTVDGRRYEYIYDADPVAPPSALLDRIYLSQRERPTLTSMPTGVKTLPYYAEDLQLWLKLDEPGGWHEAQRTLVARWVQRGIDPTTITAMAPAFRRPPYTIEQTIREIGISARGAQEKFGKPEAPPRQQGAILSLEELETQDPPEFLVDGLIPEKSFGYIYGDSNTFKTFVTLDLALSIAYGVPWQGRQAKQATVVYILGEGQGSFAKRVRVWRAARGLSEYDAPFYALLHPVYLTDKEEVPRLISLIDQKEIKPAFIFLDTIARNFGPGDPDRTQDMTVFVNAADAVRQHFGAGLFGVHHAGKDASKGARNSSVLRASADFEIRAEREEGAFAVTITNTKAKDWEEFPRTRLNLEEGEADDPRTGEMIRSLYVKQDGVAVLPQERPDPTRLGKWERKIIDALRDGEVSFGALFARLGGDRGSMGRALRNLQLKGLIEKSSDGWLLTSGVSECEF
jgi:hypothetical protein